MAEVYLYLDSEKAIAAADCGIKMSDISEGVITIKNIEYNFFRAYLHPLDAPRQKRQLCLKIDVPDRYCFVADGNLYDRLEHQDLFLETIAPIEKYELGSYEAPICIVCCSVIPGQARIEGDKYETPMLYTSSRELFNTNLQYKILGEDNENMDYLVYLYFEAEVAKGRAEKLVFEDKILYMDLKTKEFVYIERKDF